MAASEESVTPNSHLSSAQEKIIEVFNNLDANGSVSEIIELYKKDGNEELTEDLQDERDIGQIRRLLSAAKLKAIIELITKKVEQLPGGKAFLNDFSLRPMPGFNNKNISITPKGKKESDGLVLSLSGKVYVGHTTERAEINYGELIDPIEERPLLENMGIINERLYSSEKEEKSSCRADLKLYSKTLQQHINEDKKNSSITPFLYQANLTKNMLTLASYFSVIQENGYIFSDAKPGNIMVEFDDKGRTSFLALDEKCILAEEKFDFRETTTTLELVPRIETEDRKLLVEAFHLRALAVNIIRHYINEETPLKQRILKSYFKKENKIYNEPSELDKEFQEFIINLYNGKPIYNNSPNTLESAIAKLEDFSEKFEKAAKIEQANTASIATTNHLIPKVPNPTQSLEENAAYKAEPEQNTINPIAQTPTQDHVKTSVFTKPKSTFDAFKNSTPNSHSSDAKKFSGMKSRINSLFASPPKAAGSPEKNIIKTDSCSI